MAELEYQHIVPRTYFKPWEMDNTNRKLNIVDKLTGIKEVKSSKRKFGIKDFYTITIDNFYIFIEEDKKIAYRPLLKYDIEFEGKKLCSIDDYHLNFGMFAEWNISKKDGSLVNNEDVYSELKAIRILDLEKNWNVKAENDWNKTVQNIVSCINASTSINAIDYNYLYMFLASQKLRTDRFKEKYIVNPIHSKLKEIFTISDNKTEEKAIHKSLEDMYDSYYKKMIRDFQEGNFQNIASGSIIQFIESFTMVFYFNNKKTFFTSDNPIFDEVDETFPIKYRGQIFPLTPNLIVIGYIGSKSDNQYRVQEMTDKEVDEINQIIVKNASKSYIR